MKDTTWSCVLPMCSDNSVWVRRSSVLCPAHCVLLFFQKRALHIVLQDAEPFLGDLGEKHRSSSAIGHKNCGSSSLSAVTQHQGRSSVEEHVFEMWTHHFRSLHFTHVQRIFWFAPERENSKLGCLSCISSLFRMTQATLRLHCHGTI